MNTGQDAFRGEKTNQVPVKQLSSLLKVAQEDQIAQEDSSLGNTFVSRMKLKHIQISRKIEQRTLRSKVK